jgi:hypothetical protein
MQSVGSNELIFNTTNHVDIAPWHYVSIRMLDEEGETTAYITDKAKIPNLPEATNQKVRVLITGPSPKITLAPNPTQPTEAHIKAGALEAKNYPEAFDWVKSEGKGVLMQFTIILPENADTVTGGGGIDPSKLKIRCIEKIYDFVGNPVNSAVNEDLVSSLSRDELNRLNVRHKVSLYWNCFSKSGRPAAPGLYKVVIYIEYKDSKFKKYNKKFTEVLGIGR